MFSLILLINWDKIYRRMRVVLGKFPRGKGSARGAKSLFSSYCTKSPLIQLTRLGTLRNFTKLEDFSGAMVKNTLWWLMVFYKRVRNWSKKSWCYSREVSADVFIRDRVSVIEGGLSRFFLSRSSWISLEASEGSSLSMATTYMFM